MKEIYPFAPRRPPPRTQRSACWLELPGTSTGGWGAVEITVGRLVTAYRCQEIATDFGPEHVGFELHKLGPGHQPTGVVYHVLVDLARGWHRCDCLGHEAHGHCKHSAALKALCRFCPISGTWVPLIPGASASMSAGQRQRRPGKPDRKPSRSSPAIGGTMQPRFYVRASCRDGTTRISTLFDSFEEAVRWRTRVHEDPLMLVAVIVEVGPDSSHPAPAD